jgi:hypothetical protein
MNSATLLTLSCTDSEPQRKGIDDEDKDVDEVKTPKTVHSDIKDKEDDDNGGIWISPIHQNQDDDDDEEKKNGEADDECQKKAVPSSPASTKPTTTTTTTTAASPDFECNIMNTSTAHRSEAMNDSTHDTTAITNTVTTTSTSDDHNRKNSTGDDDDDDDDDENGGGGRLDKLEKDALGSKFIYVNGLLVGRHRMVLVVSSSNCKDDFANRSKLWMSTIKTTTLFRYISNAVACSKSRFCSY